MAAGLLVLVVIVLLLVWLSSVFQFIYVDNISRKSGAIAEPFARLKRLGASYFLWRLAFGAVVLLAMGVLIAAPLVAVFVPQSSAGVTARTAVVIWAVAIGIPLIILAAIIDVFARDFVIPAMYVRGVRVIEGWHAVLPVLRANIGQTILYLLMLIALAIGIFIFGCIVAIVLLIALAIPVGLLALLGYLVWQAAHLTWTAPAIGAVAGLGILIFMAYVYLIECATQPAQIFRRSFSLIVLGQADPSLAAIPLAPPPAVPPAQA